MEKVKVIKQITETAGSGTKSQTTTTRDIVTEVDSVTTERDLGGFQFLQ